MGTTLIILGILSIIIGIVLKLLPHKADSEIKNHEAIVQENNSKTKSQADVNANLEELINLVKLAAADGVITQNESDLLSNKASELGIDKKIVNQLLDSELKLKESDPETQLIDKYKEAGNTFEGYIASRFNKAYFTLKNWAGDKYYQGVYAETTVNPDLLLCFRMGNVEENFAVECKYRSYYYKGGVEWTKDYQINSYRRFESESRMPVFIAIGVGGSPDAPSELFLIPLREIDNTFLTRNFLMNYFKYDFKEKNFYFDYVNQILK
jgi:hypothetical protein